MAPVRPLPPAWAAPFVGIPFVAKGRSSAGADCWGLIRLALAERFGVEVPAYDGVGWVKDGDPKALAAFMAGHKADWRPVPAGEEREGDVVLLRRAGQPFHVGLVVAPGLMLHGDHGVDSCCESYRDRPWRFRLPSGKDISHVEGFYRYARLAG